MENHFNCIYCYTNKVNGKKYIGQAVDFERRHKQHINQAYNEKRIAYNQYFHNAIRKHGIENFEIEILKENLQNQDELNYWECYYIVEFDTLAKNQKGYNLASGGSNGNPLAGKSDEELAEIRRKNSEANKKAYHNKTDEELAEISRKISETMNNKSDEKKAEIRRKQSEANKGKKHPMYGKNHSEETRAKQSEALKGEKNPMYGVHRYGEKNGRARKVVLIDPITIQTVFIWKYKKQATDFYNISERTLDRYLKGKAKTGHEYNGFLWYYADEWEQMNK